MSRPNISILGRSVILVLRIYQKTRFLRSPSCRFYPSCSEYMVRCIQRHGALKGVPAGLIRLCKCHPFHPGGVDMVPPELSFLPRFVRQARRATVQPEPDTRG